MVELAYNVANAIDLSEDDRRLLGEIERLPDNQAVFDEYIRTILEARAAFDELTVAPGAATRPIDDNILAEYLDGVLSEDQRDQIENRLAREPGALEQLIGLVELLQPDKTPGSAVSFVFELAKKGLRLIAHPEQGFEWTLLRPAAVLGQEQDLPIQEWTQDLGPVRVQCTLQRGKEDLLGLTIRLLEPSAPPRGTRINLKSGGKLIQSDLVGEGGEVVLRDLEPATYDLDILLPATNVATMRFEFVPYGQKTQPNS